MCACYALMPMVLALLALSCPSNSFMLNLPGSTLTNHDSRIRPLRRSLVSLSATPDKEETKPGFFEFMFNPYDSKIPKELEAEIYRAEGNTPAAQERSQRVALYAIVALTLVGCAFFNGFLTELRNGPMLEENPNLTLDDLGFGWVQTNFLFQFLFTNKIGGGLALVSGAGSGMLAEAELDSRRQNAERIWNELERRRTQQGSDGNETKTRQRKQQSAGSMKKNRPSGKQKKRMGALSEVVLDERPTKTELHTETSASTVEEAATLEKSNEKGSIVEKLKGWYDTADSMAASQALLLNKELEDRGVLDKVTDETGLKVIGKDAAAKLNQEKTGVPPEQANADTKPSNSA